MAPGRAILLFSIVWIHETNCFLLPIPKSVVQQQAHRRHSRIVLWATASDDDEDETVDRTSFDQAGRSLIEEEDQRRMDQMGDYDSNPDYQMDNIEKMRAAIRARTQDLGIEKSKVSADYIAQKAAAAAEAGTPAAASQSPDTFGGLDLSKISSVKASPEWNEDMPSMFYDPEDEMTLEEQEEADPIMKLNPIEQGLHEFNNAQWPTLGAALREVGLMVLVVLFSSVLIIGWDKLLRALYTSLGFIPTAEEIRNYADRFSGLDLPKGWTDGMSEADVSQFTEQVNSALPSIEATIPNIDLP